MKKKGDKVQIWVKQKTLDYEKELSRLQVELLKLQNHVKNKGLKILIPFVLYSEIFPKDVRPFKPLPLRSLIKKFSYKSSI